MSNVLKVIDQQTIRSLYERGWSGRRIARELGLNRRTVSRYVKVISPGSGKEPDSKCAISIPGSSEGPEPKCAISTAGKAGRRSHCEGYREAIVVKVEEGLSAQRIYQDLRQETGFDCSYQSVKRFVSAIREAQPQRVWRMECQPGEEMQVDFGLGASIQVDGNKTRRSWVFRVVLSYSRKGYSEAVSQQNTETFLRCLENAIRHFGGAPLLLNLDNLKAAVLKADWFDPEINPKLAEFCRHYGMHVTPCRPATPQHKGKVERGVAYVRGNALKGRRFKSLAEENAFLSQWEENVADKRIHGTTRKQVAACFEEERPHLQPLPAMLFPCYQEARRSVHRDSYVEVAKAFYEAPPEYIGRQVWVRWDARCVRIFNDRMEQVQMHVRIEPGKFSRSLGAGGFPRPVKASCEYWISRAALLGDHCQQWARTALETRGPEALRSVMGLCDLIKKHSGSVIDTACKKALSSGTRRLKDVRRLIGEKAEQTAFAFESEHSLIRDLKTYGDFITTHNQQQEQPPKPNNRHDQHPQTECPEAAVIGTA